MPPGTSLPPPWGPFTSQGQARAAEGELSWDGAKPGRIGGLLARREGWQAGMAPVVRRDDRSVRLVLIKSRSAALTSTGVMISASLLNHKSASSRARRNCMHPYRLTLLVGIFGKHFPLRIRESAAEMCRAPCPAQPPDGTGCPQLGTLHPAPRGAPCSPAGAAAPQLLGHHQPCYSPRVSICSSLENHGTPVLFCSQRGDGEERAQEEKAILTVA